MLAFWIAASVMIAFALAFVLPTLVVRLSSPGPSRAALNRAIYRDRRRELEAERAAGNISDEHLAAALLELDRELLRDTASDDAMHDAGGGRSPYPPIVVAVLLPLVAFGGYLKLGTPEALLVPPSGAPARADAVPDSQPSGARHSLQEMVTRLERRLRDAPDDADGWLMLGRSYGAMNRLQDAREALGEASRRRPGHPLTLVALAEVTALLQGNRLDGEPIALVERALAVEPMFPRGLWLAGIYALDHGDPARARALLQRLMTVPGLSPEESGRIREAIARAGGTPVAGAAEASASRERVIANVGLSPELASRLDGSETLFVFAQATEGPPMPLAVARRRAGELPLRVTLDDSMAMAPQMRLSSFQKVVVSARVSRSGSANPLPGDLLGRSAPVSPGVDTTVHVVIDRVVQ